MPAIRPAAFFLLLTATIGLPYVLLSTTSPLLQAWYVAARPGAVPYRLFALSNLGSLLALFSFPLLVEPLVGDAHASLRMVGHLRRCSWCCARRWDGQRCAHLRTSNRPAER